MNNWKVHLRTESGDPACGREVKVNLALTNNPAGVTCKHCMPHASRLQDALPRHDPEYEERVFLVCPKCRDKQPSSWGALDNGTRIICDACSYEWIVDTQSTRTS